MCHTAHFAAFSDAFSMLPQTRITYLPKFARRAKKHGDPAAARPPCPPLGKDPVSQVVILSKVAQLIDARITSPGGLLAWSESSSSGPEVVDEQQWRGVLVASIYRTRPAHCESI
jgi:hypothetical protein